MLQDSKVLFSIVKLCKVIVPKILLDVREEFSKFFGKSFNADHIFQMGGFLAIDEFEDFRC